VNYVWKRITNEDIDRFVRNYNLTPVERQILELRSAGFSLAIVGDKIGYDERHIRRLSAKLLDKIKNEL